MKVSTPFWLDSNEFPRRRIAKAGTVPDVAVIGAGVTGCSCALALAQGGKRVRVYEAREVATGASGRNGGLALRGTALSYDRAIEKLGEDTARTVWQATEDGLRQISEIAGSAFRQTGSVRYAIDDDEISDIEGEYEALARDGFAVRWLERTAFPLPQIQRAFVHTVDGTLEPALWVRRLAQAAAAEGVEFREQARVSSLSELDEIEHVVVATDGYTSGLLPELDLLVKPVRSQVLATVPLPETIFPYPFYGRHRFDYWQQTVEGRIVIGGRRDLATSDEFVREEAITPQIQGEIETLLKDLLGFLPEITHRWSGVFGQTPDRHPVVGTMPGPDRVWVSCAYSGHGNVLGFICGRAVAAGILGNDSPLLGCFDAGRLAPL